MNENFFRKNFKESLNYLRDSKNYIYFIILVFFVFLIFAFIFPVPESFTKIIDSFIEDLLSQTKEMSYSELAWFIFSNNLQSSFFGMIYGIVLGIFSIITASANGYLLGYVAFEVIKAESAFVLWRILPHGIFELPALFISLGLGLKLGFWLISEPVKFYWKKNSAMSFLLVLFYLPVIIVALIYNKKLRKVMKKRYNVFSQDFFRSLKSFLFIVLPLLILAAIIEAGLIILI